MDENENSENRFQTEMIRKIDLLIQKVGGVETRFDNLESDVSEIKSDVKVLKGQFNDVAVMAIEDNKRITKQVNTAIQQQCRLQTAHAPAAQCPLLLL